MTDTTGMVRHDAADPAESLLTQDDADLERQFTILTHRQTGSLIERREALRPLYETIVARIGQPTSECLGHQRRRQRRAVGARHRNRRAPAPRRTLLTPSRFPRRAGGTGGDRNGSPAWNAAAMDCGG
ncbi:hypothetical protein [Streptomyces sp. NPDC002553]|uniref:hypothetical protein n=1 Tax=Streptomyces sp. NPDC002553 TaxID=3154417 RepID=UPI00333393E1